MMIQLLLVLAMFSGFTQKWYIPYGTIAPGGRILVYDSDHDGQIELIFRRWIAGSVGVYFAEYVPPDSWDIIESSTVDSVLVWDCGDYDRDGYADLVTDGNASGSPIPIISIYESPDSFSYPTTEVWRDTVDIGTVQPICAHDIDKDGYPEIIQTGGEIGTNYYIDFSIYESISNNDYEVIYQYESPETPTSTVAFGDFDQDSLTEFVLGTIDGQYSIFECVENDSYLPLHENSQLSTVNIKDCCAIPDADQDGKWEFVVKGFVIPTAEIHAFIFEATGDNTYEVTQTFTLPGGDYYGGYSEAGDVDGDSISEIVLEAQYNVFIIKAASDNTFYVWDTLPGHGSGSCVRVYDIDNNGLAEIIISGEDETRIYEYDVGIEERNENRVVGTAIHIFPNPFTTSTTISLSAAQNTECIELKIYDISGREVKSFSLPTAYSLLSTITWDGTDDAGQPLSSGVYFMHLETQNRRIVEKIVLLR
jgi:hypothetical protein